MLSAASVHTDECCLEVWPVSDFRDSGVFLGTLMSSIDVCLDDTWLPLEDWIVCPASSKLGSSLVHLALSSK